MVTCPKCGSHEAVKGIQYGHANIYPENLSMFKLGSEIIHVFCSNCGFIIESFVKNPDKFKRK